MDARREIGIDEGACVADDTGIWTSVCASTVGPVRRVLDIRRQLGLREKMPDATGFLDGFQVELLATQRACPLLVG